ncbi:hypothetical protein FBU30_003062, partial [Linnemannia zychae]
MAASPSPPSSPSSSSTSTPSYNGNKDDIASLVRSLVQATLRQDINALKHQQHHTIEPFDKAIKPQVPYTIYEPTEDEIQQYPALKPERPIDFFIKNKITDTELKDQFRIYPRNIHMGQYKAPKVPSVVANNTSFNKKQDNQIREFQERYHLGGLACKMHETRMENVRSSVSTTKEDEDFIMFDSQTLHDE